MSQRSGFVLDFSVNLSYTESCLCLCLCNFHWTGITDVVSCNHVWLCEPVEYRTITHQVPLSMGFSRQEYWSGLPFLPLENLSDPGIEPISLTSPALAFMLFIISTTWEAVYQVTNSKRKYFWKKLLTHSIFF